MLMGSEWKRVFDFLIQLFQIEAFNLDWFPAFFSRPGTWTLKISSKSAFQVSSVSELWMQLRYLDSSIPKKRIKPKLGFTFGVYCFKTFSSIQCKYPVLPSNEDSSFTQLQRSAANQIWSQKKNMNWRQNEFHWPITKYTTITFIAVINPIMFFKLLMTFFVASMVVESIDTNKIIPTYQNWSNSIYEQLESDNVLTLYF